MVTIALTVTSTDTATLTKQPGLAHNSCAISFAWTDYVFVVNSVVSGSKEVKF